MNFVTIAQFNNKLEAETVAHVLDASDIEFLIQSDVGIFGEGGVGAYVKLQVPAERAEEAKILLADVTDEI